MNSYSFSGFFREMLARHFVLGSYALFCLAGALVTTAMLIADPRVVDGASVWLKPLKFFLSIAIFSGTAAWFFGYIRPDRRNSWLMRITVATLLLTAGFELLWITWQGAHGLRSHFNFDTPLYASMYALMGLGATLLVATTLPLAWAIARTPTRGLDEPYRLAVIAGLLLTFVLGGSIGGTISANSSSAIGAYSSSIPLFAWNQLGGDLRVAHFLGIHAEQAIPLIAITLRKAGWRERLPVVAAASFWAALTIGLWVSAKAGHPLI